MNTQQMTALEQANYVRVTRAAERRRVERLPRDEGRRVVAALLLDPPDWLRSAQAFKVLRWIRLFPKRTATEALRFANASDTRTVGELTLRQRRIVAALVLSGLEPRQFARVTVGQWVPEERAA